MLYGEVQKRKATGDSGEAPSGARDLRRSGARAEASPFHKKAKGRASGASAAIEVSGPAAS